MRLAHNQTINRMANIDISSPISGNLAFIQPASPSDLEKADLQGDGRLCHLCLHFLVIVRPVLYPENLEKNSWQMANAFS